MFLLFTEVLFCWHLCQFDMLSVLCDYSSCLHDTNMEWSLMMIVITLPFHGIMGPQSPIFPLNHYSRPYGERSKHLEVSLSLSFFVWLFIITLWYSSSLSIPTGSLLITVIMPLIGWLNIMVAGLGSPCPSGIIVSATELSVGHSWNQTISLVCIVQMLCMPLLAHYYDGDMMMRMPVLCLGFCRRSWIYWKQNYHQNLTFFS